MNFKFDSSDNDNPTDNNAIVEEPMPHILIVNNTTFDSLEDLESLKLCKQHERLIAGRTSWPPYLRDSDWEDDDWYPENDFSDSNMYQFQEPYNNIDNL